MSIVVNYACCNPRIRIVVLIEISDGAALCQAGNSSIRTAKLQILLRIDKLQAKKGTYDDLVFCVEEIRRISREDGRSCETIVGIQNRGGPFPNAAIGALSTPRVQTCSRTAIGVVCEYLSNRTNERTHTGVDASYGTQHWRHPRILLDMCRGITAALLRWEDGRPWSAHTRASRRMRSSMASVSRTRTRLVHTTCAPEDCMSASRHNLAPELIP